VVTDIIDYYQQNGFHKLLKAIGGRTLRKFPFKYQVEIRHRYNMLTYSKNINHPLTIYFVKPDEIKYRSQRFDRRLIGQIRSGNWDQTRDPLEEHHVQSGLHQRFIEGMSWHETDYYNQIIEMFKQKEVVYGYSNLREFEQHQLPYLDDLFESIKENGYKRQMELDSESHGMRHQNKPEWHYTTHEIGVNIGRDGTLLLNSGHHRLAIAKILNLDEIPVIIIICHKGAYNMVY